jgi:hypothetical protein
VTSTTQTQTTKSRKQEVRKSGIQEVSKDEKILLTS